MVRTLWRGFSTRSDRFRSAVVQQARILKSFGGVEETWSKHFADFDDELLTRLKIANPTVPELAATLDKIQPGAGFAALHLMVLLNELFAKPTFDAACLLRNAALHGLAGPYLDCEHSNRLLQRTSSKSGTTIRIRAPMGAGKTCLLQHVAAMLGDKVLLLTVEQGESGIEAVCTSGDRWNISKEYKSFYNFVTQKLHHGVHVFIDEVQRLPPSIQNHLLQGVNSLTVPACLVGAGVPAVYLHTFSEKSLWREHWTFPGLTVPREQITQCNFWSTHVNDYLDLCETPYDGNIHVGFFMKLLFDEIKVFEEHKAPKPTVTYHDLLKRFLVRQEVRLGLAVAHWPKGMESYLEHLLLQNQPISTALASPKELMDTAESLGLLWVDTATQTCSFPSKLIMLQLLYYFGTKTSRSPVPLYCTGARGVTDAFNALLLAITRVNWSQFWASERKSDGLLLYEATFQQEMFHRLCQVSTVKQNVFPEKFIKNIHPSGSGVVDHWVDDDCNLGLVYLVSYNARTLAEHLIRFLPKTARTNLPQSFAQANSHVAQYNPANFKSACCAVILWQEDEKVLLVAKDWNMQYALNTATICAVITGTKESHAAVEVPGFMPRQTLNISAPYTVDAAWRMVPLEGQALHAWVSLPN
eukprot:TRINITY_DN7220_c0_g1_i1.p1 TRINITY_DN7220_c0_g1~~TRINITY_DN7220_c0_g1_i1.p1  ORF type:complete len:641 (+),score=92.95 TRINITY_DN7220_c0_g1_i1:55-1977(+)